MYDADSLLNYLIAACRDSEVGFGQAAKSATSDDLRTKFTRMAQLRAEFADQLQTTAETLGVTPDPASHAGQISHQGWTHVEEGVSPLSDRALISACRTGEFPAWGLYEEALAMPDLPASLRVILERQFQQLQETLNALDSALPSA